MNYHSGVSDVLMKATVDTLPNQECRRKWENGEDFLLSPRRISLLEVYKQTSVVVTVGVLWS